MPTWLTRLLLGRDAAHVIERAGKKDEHRLYVTVTIRAVTSLAGGHDEAVIQETMEVANWGGMHAILRSWAELLPVQAQRAFPHRKGWLEDGDVGGGA